MIAATSSTRAPPRTWALPPQDPVGPIPTRSSPSTLTNRKTRAKPSRKSGVPPPSSPASALRTFPSPSANGTPARVRRPTSLWTNATSSATPSPSASPRRPITCPARRSSLSATTSAVTRTLPGFMTSRATPSAPSPPMNSCMANSPSHSPVATPSPSRRPTPGKKAPSSSTSPPAPRPSSCPSPSRIFPIPSSARGRDLLLLAREESTSKSLASPELVSAAAVIPQGAASYSHSVRGICCRRRLSFGRLGNSRMCIGPHS